MTADPALDKFWQANEFKGLEIIRGTVKVELQWFLEGRGAHYNHEDPEDFPALRFTVWRKMHSGLGVEDGRLLRGLHPRLSDWQQVKFGSQRTRLSAVDPIAKLQWALDFIVDLVVPRVEQGLGIRGICWWLRQISKEGITLKD